MRLAWLLTGSVSLLPIVAFAQDGSVTNLETIVVVEDGDAEDLEVPPGTIIVTAEELERLNPQDLQDVFITEPTVTVGSSIPMSQKIYVQGIEEPNLAVTIDGARQNNKIFHHNATTLIDPDLLKAVRVDPGVAPADAGPGALGGAIAFETKDVDDLLAPGRNFGGQISPEFETNGSIWTTSGTVFGRQDGFEGLFFGKFAEGDQREDGNGDPIVGSGTDLLSGLGKVAYEAESGDRIEAAFEIVKDDEARPYRANIGRIIVGRPVPPTRNYDLERQNYTLTYTDETPTDLWDPKIQLAYSVTDLGIDEPDQFSFGTTESLNGRAENTFTISHGTVTAGVDFFVDEAELDYRYLPDPTENLAGREKAQNVGFYAQGRFDVTDRFRTSLGARVDVQRFEGVDGTEMTNSGPSVNLSGEFDLTEVLMVHAGVSRVWAGIPLAENFIINPLWVYDTEIEPVTADNVSAGLKAQHNGFSAGARVFQTRIYDARTPAYRVGPAVQRDIETKGVELTAGYQNGAFEGSIGYAFIDSEIDGKPADSELGRYLTVPVGHIFKASLAYTFLERGVTVGATAEIALEYDDTYDADTGLPGPPLPGYEVVNAFVEWTPVQNENFTLRGEVKNLFDEAYVARGTYGTEYATVEPLLEPGRSFLAKATLRF